LGHASPSFSKGGNAQEPFPFPSPHPVLHNLTLFAMPQVNGELLHLQKLDKYKTEKPFTVIFDVSDFGPGSQQTNVRLESKSVRFVDIKTAGLEFRLDQHGFELRSFPTSLEEDDFRHEDTIANKYYPELERFLRETLGPDLDQVFFLNHQVSGDASLDIKATL
jgi:hypothetical protein